MLTLEISANQASLIFCEDVAPVIAVRGNADKGAWAEALPLFEVIEAAGHFLYLIHDINMLDLDPCAAGMQAVISGHSHVPGVSRKDGVLYLNPGSAGPKRFKLPVSAALLRIEPSGEIVAELRGSSHEQEKQRIWKARGGQAKCPPVLSNPSWGYTNASSRSLRVLASFRRASAYSFLMTSGDLAKFDAITPDLRNEWHTHTQSQTWERPMVDYPTSGGRPTDPHDSGHDCLMARWRKPEGLFAEVKLNALNGS